MPFTANDYRQFAHDSLNILGRLQSVSELAEIEDEALKSLFEKDLQNLERALKYFAKIGWCLQQDEISDKSRVEASSILFEVVSGDRPEGALLSIDENISVETDAVLLKAIFAELVHNMAAHGDANSSSKVTFGRTSKGYVLETKNAAKYDLPENASEAFAKGNESHGLGLGLTMVQEAAKLLEMPFEIKADGKNVVTTLLVAKA